MYVSHRVSWHSSIVLHKYDLNLRSGLVKYFLFSSSVWCKEAFKCFLENRKTEMGNKTKTKYESYWNEHEFESSVLAWIQVKLITITNKKNFLLNILTLSTLNIMLLQVFVNWLLTEHYISSWLIIDNSVLIYKFSWRLSLPPKTARPEIWYTHTERKLDQ